MRNLTQLLLKFCYIFILVSAIRIYYPIIGNLENPSNAGLIFIFTQISIALFMFLISGVLLFSKRDKY